MGVEPVLASRIPPTLQMVSKRPPSEMVSFNVVNLFTKVPIIGALEAISTLLIQSKTAQLSQLRISAH